MKKGKFMGAVLAFATLFSVAIPVSSVKAAENKTAQDTELVFVIDKSGSMWDLTDDTIGGFNSTIKEQKDPSKKGKVNVTTVMFNWASDTIHDRVDIEHVNPISRENYSPSGCTALLDAVGSTISKLSSNRSIEKHKVVFVIITDGYENASREFTRAQIKRMIEQKTAQGWEFIFLGANIDSVKEGASIGVSSDRSRSFTASSVGVHTVYKCVCNAIDQARGGKQIDLDEAMKKGEQEATA